MHNGLLLLAEAVLYFSIMTMLFRWRSRIGIGVFMCALGVMHFLETYLASVFYVTLPFGIVSPGSAVLFSGKLVMLLLLYIKEDAAIVRQPIYGLLFGNAMMVLIVIVLRQHDLALLPSGKMPDIAFIDEMGWLMVWGTTLLFFDAIVLILAYEKFGRVFRKALFPRIFVAVSCVLTIDQVGFYTALHLYSDAPPAVFIGGWLAKMASAVVFSVLLMAYLRWAEAPRLQVPRGLTDVFEMLTYRERYEALVQTVGRDALTGLLHRGRFQTDAEHAVARALHSGQPLSLLVLDVDHFKSINDRFGHAEGDRALKSIAALLTEAAGADAHVYRIGGEEFALLCWHAHPVARLLGENIRLAIKASANRAAGFDVTVSVGIATLTHATPTVATLFALADERLYKAKAGGRDRVIGATVHDVGEQQAHAL